MRLAVITPPLRADGNQRNAWLDVIRAVAIIRVVFWHTYGAAWISYVVASIPLMFFVAGSLMHSSMGRGNAGDILYRRFRRMLVPFWALAVVSVGLMIAYDQSSAYPSATFSFREIPFWVLPIWDPQGSDWALTWWAPLWYLRCFTWLLLLTPPLLWFWRRLGLPMLLVPVVALILLESYGNGETLPWQAQDAALYSFFWMLGFAYDDGHFARITRHRRGILCVGFVLAALGWSFATDVPSGIVNASYPMHLLVALAWLFGALTFEEQISSLARQPQVAPVLYQVNQRALTIYLWHTTGLFCMYQVLFASDHSSFARNILAFPIVAAVTTLAVLLFGWIEDAAGARSRRIWPDHAPRLGPLWRRSPGMLVAGLFVATIGVATVATTVHQIVEDPLSSIQASARTVPASGVGLQIRSMQAVLTKEAPKRERTTETAPVTGEALQKFLDGWREKSGIEGVTISVLRPSGEGWTGASGDYGDGVPRVPGDVFWIGSVTKTFTAALTMRLVEADMIRLEDPVSLYIPQFPQSNTFTVEDLLRHTSGLIPGDLTPDLAISEAAREGLQFEPGTAFLYSRVGYHMLGLIIEEVTGMSYTHALRSQFIDPFGLVSTFMDEEIFPFDFSTHPFETTGGGVIWTSGGLYRDDSVSVHPYYGTHWSSGGIYSTTPDLARWTLSVWGSDLVVSAASLDRMTTFFGPEYGFTGIGVYAACPCWQDGNRIRAERWTHLGPHNSIEYDPTDLIALVMDFTGDVSDPAIVAAMDDLSAQLRGFVRGRAIEQ